jgi:hypothetical protein
MKPITPPPSLINASDQIFRNEADRGFSRIYQAHTQLQSQAIVTPVVNGAYLGFTGYHGSTTVTGSKLGVATGLTTVTRVVAMINSDGLPLNELVTARPAKAGPDGAIDLFVWKPTAAGDTTPIASTTAQNVEWWVMGT